MRFIHVRHKNFSKHAQNDDSTSIIGGWSLLARLFVPAAILAKQILKSSYAFCIIRIKYINKQINCNNAVNSLTSTTLDLLDSFQIRIDPDAVFEFATPFDSAEYVIFYFETYFQNMHFLFLYTILLVFSFYNFT